MIERRSQVYQRWCSINGKTWTTVINDITAIVWLEEDEKTYKTILWWPNRDSSFNGDYDCLKKAKEACLEAIEHVDDFKYLAKVILRGKMYGAYHVEYHDTVQEAAASAYWSIENNTFMPCEIESQGQIVWKNGMITDEEYPSLASLAKIEDDE